GGIGQQIPPWQRLCENHGSGEVRGCPRQTGYPAMNRPTPVHNIGSYVPMIDGPEKVSGRAKYTADIVGVGQFAGCIYRSPYAHGEIVDVDVSEALKIPGVVAIVTG